MELRFRKAQRVEWRVKGTTKTGTFTRYEIAENLGVFRIRAYVWSDFDKREICIEPKMLQPEEEHYRRGGYVSVYL